MALVVLCTSMKHIEGKQTFIVLIQNVLIFYAVCCSLSHSSSLNLTFFWAYIATMPAKKCQIGAHFLLRVDNRREVDMTLQWF